MFGNSLTVLSSTGVVLTIGIQCNQHFNTEQNSINPALFGTSPEQRIWSIYRVSKARSYSVNELLLTTLNLQE
jgi:hypothetical protein